MCHWKMANMTCFASQRCFIFVVMLLELQVSVFGRKINIYMYHEEQFAVREIQKRDIIPEDEYIQYYPESGEDIIIRDINDNSFFTNYTKVMHDDKMTNETTAENNTDMPTRDNLKPDDVRDIKRKMGSFDITEGIIRQANKSSISNEIAAYVGVNIAFTEDDEEVDDNKDTDEYVDEGEEDEYDNIEDAIADTQKGEGTRMPQAIQKNNKDDAHNHESDDYDEYDDNNDASNAYRNDEDDEYFGNNIGDGAVWQRSKRQTDESSEVPRKKLKKRKRKPKELGLEKAMIMKNLGLYVGIPAVTLFSLAIAYAWYFCLCKDGKCFIERKLIERINNKMQENREKFFEIAQIDAYGRIYVEDYTEEEKEALINVINLLETYAVAEARRIRMGY